jgi:hypothetical protein
MTPEPAALQGRAAEHGRPLSDVLAQMAGDPSRERISIADLLVTMRDRALAALLLLFALPNVLPVPPGTSVFLGAPLLFLAAQLALGKRPWLPKLIANRSMTRGDFGVLIARAANCRSCLDDGKPNELHPVKATRRSSRGLCLETLRAAHRMFRCGVIAATFRCFAFFDRPELG